MSKKNNRVVVEELTESDIPLEDVYKLIISSFQQWKENGLNSAVANYSFDEYKSKLHNATILVAHDSDNCLLGTHTISFNTPKCCFGKFLAVSPNAKRLGVGTFLFEKQCEIARQRGCEYILEDTSESAYWSVAWHLKQGYYIVGYESFSTNNYYSFIFRKQLVPSKLWDCMVYCKFIYYLSYCKTKLLKTRYGRYTTLGSYFAKIKKIFK